MRPNDRARKMVTRPAASLRYIRQANRHVYRDDRGILRKIQKFFEGYDVETEFACIAIFQYRTPFTFEAVYATKPNHLPTYIERARRACERS